MGSWHLHPASGKRRNWDALAPLSPALRGLGSVTGYLPLHTGLAWLPASPGAQTRLRKGTPSPENGRSPATPGFSLCFSCILASTASLDLVFPPVRWVWQGASSLTFVLCLLAPWPGSWPMHHWCHWPAALSPRAPAGLFVPKVSSGLHREAQALGSQVQILS